MSSQHKSKPKVSDEELEAHAETQELIEDGYEPQVEAVGELQFDTILHGQVACELIAWADSRYTELTVNVYRYEPTGMAMTTYRPILIGSYPIPNRKH